MAVVFDASTEFYGDFAGDQTISHTPVGTPTVAITHVLKDRAGDIDVNGVSYGGTTMTLLATVSGTNAIRNRTYALEDPASGTQNCVVNSTGNVDLSVSVQTYTGSDTTDSIGDIQTSSGANLSSTSTSTAAVSSSSGDLVIDNFGKQYTNEAVSLGTGQTQIFQQGVFSGGGFGRHVGSYKDGAASVTMSESWSTANGYTHIVVNLLQAAGGGGVTVNPSVQSVSFSLPTSTVSGAASVAPSTQSATFSVPAASSTGGASTTLAVQNATFLLPTSTILTDQILTIAAQAATFLIPTYSIGAGDVVIAAAAQNATLTIPTYAATGAALTSPAAQTATFSVPAHSTTGGALSPANTQSSTFTVPTHTSTGSAQVSPAAQSSTFSTPAPTVATSSTISAAAISATFSAQAVQVLLNLITVAVADITLKQQLLTNYTLNQEPRDFTLKQPKRDNTLTLNS